MLTNRKVLKVRRYKAGYEIREELVDGSEYGCENYTMKTAYTSSGDYIGDTKFAYRLCKKWGIAPEKIGPDSNVCSIGFCEKEQKWYGWSHRAIFGFGVGAKTKKGDCGFVLGNVLELFGSLSESQRENVIDVSASGISIRHNYVQQTPYEPPVGEENQRSSTDKTEEAKCEWTQAELSYYTIEVGRGEWTAETLDDAKQMAIDFAKGVS